MILRSKTYSQESKDQVVKKSGLSRGKIIGIVIIVVALICTCILINIFIANPSTFPDQSSINGVNVSGMTVSQAKASLTKEWNKKSITVKSNGSTVGTISNSDFDYAINDKITDCLHPGFFSAIGRTFNKDKRNYTIKMTPAKATKSFNSQFKALSIVTNGNGTVTTKNAYVNMSNTDFNIVKEVYGNNLDKAKLKKAILNSIAKGDDSFTYVAKKYYAVPTVKSNSKKLTAKQKYCKENLTTKITYNAPLRTYTIKPYDLDKMITVSDGKISVNEKNVRKFVKKLAVACNSVGATRKFNSLHGGTYTIYGGTYGYTINVNKETKKLIADLKTGKDVTRKPVYSRTAKGTTGNNDIGSTYVEVSIGSQHCWYVQNGKTLLSCSVVTGTTSTGHGTPTGVYYILYKSRNTTLKGSNTDGSKYATKVSYWMPFYNGDGLHDAWWRSAFGGTIYKTGGSHGCVNMPSSQAAKLYSYVSAGTPVVIHN